MTSAQNNGSSLLDGWMSGWDTFWDTSNYWLCSAYSDPDDMQYNKQWADSLENEWVVRVGPRSSGIPNILVDYCLVGAAADNEGRCGLHHSMHIMIVVCVCTAVEFMLILWTARHFRKGEKKRCKRILVTMGNAISDFLEEPDVHINNTRKRCGYRLSVVEWVECYVSWFKAASLRLWALLIVV
jgi:hypothetical protein